MLKTLLLKGYSVILTVRLPIRLVLDMGKTSILSLKDLIKKIIDIFRYFFSEKLRSPTTIFFRKKRITLAIGAIAFTSFLCCCFLLKSLYVVGVTRTSIDVSVSVNGMLSPRINASFLKNTHFRVIFYGNGKDELVIYSNIPKGEQVKEVETTRKLSIRTSKNLHLRKNSSIDGREPTGIKYDFTRKLEDYDLHWFDLEDGGAFLMCTFEGNIFGTRRDEHQMELYLDNLVSEMEFDFPFSLSIDIPEGVDPKFIPNDGMEKSSTHSYLLYTSGSFPLTSIMSYPPYVYVSWIDKIGQETVRSQFYVLGVFVSITLSFLVKIILDFVSFCEEYFFTEE